MEDPRYAGLTAALGRHELRPFRETDPFWTTEVEGNADRLKWSASPETFAAMLADGTVTLAN